MKLMQNVIQYRVWDTVKNKFKNLAKPTQSKLRHNGEFYSRNEGELLTLNEDGVLNYGNRLIFQQFTGLKDENGKKIFEGDIIKITDEEGPSKQESYVGFIKYNNELARFEYIEKNKTPASIGELMEETFCEFEIIGNIFENPDLLK